MENTITARIYTSEPRKTCKEIIDNVLIGFKKQVNGERFEFVEFAEHEESNRLLFLSNDNKNIQKFLHFGLEKGLRTEIYLGYGEFFQVGYNYAVVKSESFML